jgi:hypothetical protein
MQPISIIAALLLLAFQVDSKQPCGDFKIKAAYINAATNDYALPEHFLLRARNNGFTHILAEYYLNWDPLPDDWHKGIYRHKDSAGIPNGGHLFDILQKHFIAADKLSLKLIPMLPICTPAANHWLGTQNPHLETGLLGVPSLAPDPKGFDFSFSEAIKVIAAAFSSSNLTYENLDYIHLNYGEAYNWPQRPCLPDEKEPCKSGRKLQLLFGNTPHDRLWLANNEATLSELFVNSLVNRIKQIKSIAILSSAHIIIYSCMFDSQLYSGHTSHCCIQNAAIDLSDVPSLLPPEMAESLIFMQWWYLPKFLGFTYHPRQAFRQLSRFGNRIIFMGSIADNDDFSHIAKRSMHLRSTIQAALAPDICSHIIGFASGHWDTDNSGYGKGTDITWQTMEYLSNQASGLAKPE